MKTRILIILVMMVALVSSCLVKSLHPFFKAEDVIFNQNLLGIWIDQDSAIWHINQQKNKEAYDIKILDEETTRFVGHLFQLDGQTYLDFFPNDDRYESLMDYHFVPTHSIAKVDITDDKNFNVSWMDEEWIHNMFKENRIRISHEVVYIEESSRDTSYVLTASTDELQKFVIKYASIAYNEEGLQVQLTKLR